MGKLQRRQYLSLTIGSILAGTSATAKENPVRLDIPPQKVGSALNELARQAQVQIISDGASLQNTRSQGVSGNYSAKEAMPLLLAGTGLGYTFTAENAVAVKADGGGSSAQLDLEMVNVTEEAERSKRVRDEEKGRKQYAVDHSFAATKTETPIMETPVAIQVVPRSVMNDQQVIDVEQAVENVSSVLSSGNFYEGFIIRGFNTDGPGNIYRNGLRQMSLAALETANLREIEVLKGPASMLYGRIQPGGLVNLAPKRALEAPYFSVQQQFGSYDLYRTTIDATGPLLDDGTLLGRINLAYRGNHSFRDFENQDNLLVAPSLTWRPTEDFEFNLDIEYQHYTYWFDDGIPAVGNRPAQVPLSRYLDDALYTMKDNPSLQEKTLLAFDWTYRFADNWKLVNRFQFTDTYYYQHDTWFGDLSEDTGLLTRGLWNTPLRRDTYATNLDVVGNFDTRFMHHDVLVGFDLFRFNQKDGPGGPKVPFGDPINTINIYDPVYSGIDITDLNPGTHNFAYLFNTSWYGLYFQDQITLFENLHIMGGGRQDWIDQDSGESPTGDFNAIQTTAVRANKFNPRVGVLYQPWPWLSLYGNYSEGFGNLNAGRSLDGRTFAPETAREGEVGIKTEFFEKRLMATLAFYDLTKQNVLAPDPRNIRFSTTLGEARSQGLELDVSGNLTENWSVVANYAYTDAKVTKGDPDQVGNRLYNVPRNAGRVWTKYEFGDGFLEGLSFGTGILARGQRQGDVANTVQLPGFVRWDASVAYTFKQFDSKITTQLNVYNILDKNYYVSSLGSRLSQMPGAPLTFLGSVRVEF